MSHIPSRNYLFGPHALRLCHSIGFRSPYIDHRHHYLSLIHNSFIAAAFFTMRVKPSPYFRVFRLRPSRVKVTLLALVSLGVVFEISFCKPVDYTATNQNRIGGRHVANKTRRYNDGTARKSDYRIEDDMLFVARAKQNRAGQGKESYRWPKGRIPYTFAPGYSDEELKQIYYTMKHIEKYTCVRFVFRTESDENYLYIRNVEGKCQSFVGNVRRGAQQIALDPESRNCAYPNFPGHVLHELIHAVGFFHEHARDDRDSYIEILYENLSEDDDVLRNFYKNSDADRTTDYYGVPYNYGSIMHYSSRAGSINGDDTLVRRSPLPESVPKPFEGEMGQREKLSEGDVLMIRNMYKDVCPDNTKMVSHGIVPKTFPDVLDWVQEQDKGENINFPVESISEDDDDDEDEEDDSKVNSAAAASTKRRENSRFNDIL